MNLGMGETPESLLFCDFPVAGPRVWYHQNIVLTGFNSNYLPFTIRLGHKAH